MLGPNKNGFVSILRPFGDAIILFAKEKTFYLIYNYISGYVDPVLDFVFINLNNFSIFYLMYYVQFNWITVFKKYVLAEKTRFKPIPIRNISKIKVPDTNPIPDD